MSKFRLRIVPYWRKWWKHGSTWMIALLGVLGAMPEHALQVFALLPVDIQDMLPGKYVLIPVLAIIAVVVRFTSFFGDDDAAQIDES